MFGCGKFSAARDTPVCSRVAKDSRKKARTSPLAVTLPRQRWTVWEMGARSFTIPL
jgi:hypothetical protein